MKNNHRMFTLIILAVVSVFALTGCIANKSNTSAGYSGPAPEALPPVPGYAGDIKDIVVPSELKWDRENSIAIKTESFRGGIYVYKGSVSILSLKDFMVESMQDNKWKQVGETASKDIMLAFVKPNKTCMMVLSETDVFGKTNLTFYVTIDQAAAASLNPFGEAVSQ